MVSFKSVRHSTLTAPELVGSVAESRIFDVIKNANGSRVVYAIVDLDADLTSAIGIAVATIPLDGGKKIEVAIHKDLAIDELSRELQSNDVATRFRNRKDDGVVATVFSVPGRQMEEVLQSLGSVERINETWLCDPEKANVWAAQTLPGHPEKTLRDFEDIVRGLIDSDILASPRMLADFCAGISASMEGKEGLPLVKAINRALPHLRLPRDCMLEITQDTLASNAAVQFRRLRDEYQPHFYLTYKGETRPRHEMLNRIDTLQKEKSLEEDVIEPLKDLVNDRTVTTGIWNNKQQRVANIPWSQIQAFFDERKPIQTINLGERTIQFLNDQYPGNLTHDEVTLLKQIKRDTGKTSPEHEDIFVRHREYLRNDKPLYKKWERLIYDKAVEANDDLLLGLIKLAESAFSNADDSIDDPVLLVNLRNAKQMSFWTNDKNTDLCTYLRDRYRGLDKILKPHVELRFGHCWEGKWENKLASEGGNKNKKGSVSAEFSFEAYVVPRDSLSSIKDNSNKISLSRNKAQMTWKPGYRTFATALSDDFKRVLKSGEVEKKAFLLRSKVSASRSAGSTSAERATVNVVTSITDSLGGSNGALANPEEKHLQSNWNRIDLFWEDKLLNSDLLSEEECDVLCNSFRRFRKDYTSAIAAMAQEGGAGLSDAALINQAKSYGALLTELRKIAGADTLIHDIWEPLIQLGTATVHGASDAMIVTPWHPLRLFELAVKAHQAAQVIERIVASSTTNATDIKEYVKDRVQAMGASYYANVGLLRADNEPQLLVETEFHAGYSLLEPPISQTGTVLSEEPTKDTIQQFGEIAKDYLKKNPHERANFSAVLLDAESEELPVLVANHLAKQIEGETDLRCDLTVTHEDPNMLRQIYEQQNRRIGHEIESSLTSEAARIFLSRLRVGIVGPRSLGSHNGTKSQDILLLHDVIARCAGLTWHETSSSGTGMSPLDHVPNDVSRRKSQSSGGLSTSVYLTSPSQVELSQAYLDAVYDAINCTSSNQDKHFIPALEVRLQSGAVSSKLKLAHEMANWVITYDRIADRKIIEETGDNLRILRYFSTPRSLHNVIVSTEYSRTGLRDRLQDDMENILPKYDRNILDNLIHAIYKRSAKLSGGIVMRGAHWDNYARELIGIIIAQREIEMLLTQEGESRTAMFFLDEFKGWFEINGEISDILAVDLYASPSKGAILRLVVSEAKCVDSNNVSASKKKSWAQLENTYTAVVNRFVGGDATVDPAIWRNRIADMLIEHMDPWRRGEKLSNMVFDDWISKIRNGGIPIEVSAHSIITVHDRPTSPRELDLFVADADKRPDNSRRLAQWTLGAEAIKKSLQWIATGESYSLLHEPEEWARYPQEMTPGHSDGTPSETKNEPCVVAETELERSEEISEDDCSSNTGGTVEIIHTPSELIAKVKSCDVQESHTALRHESHIPDGWKPEVYTTLMEMSRIEDERKGQDWLDSNVRQFKRALQAENIDAPVEGTRLTPNTGLVHVGGQSLTVGWLEKKQTDLLTRHGIEIVRITPKPGRIAVALKRPERAILHLADAWKRRKLEADAPNNNMAVVIGEQEDNGELFYLSLKDDFAHHERAAPHTLVSGTTGSGKGILTSNLILDFCAFNNPRLIEIYLIDPKRGADYLWARDLPHLRGGIIEEKEATISLLNDLIQKMEDRYRKITRAGCANIDQYNQRQRLTKKLPHMIIFFDEVANWMQDNDFKANVENLINEIATKSRAAGLHLFMIYQRADNHVMTMQLRTNLGNKLILRLGDEGSSRIALGEKGAERLLGKGHVIAKLGSDEKIYGQVPYIRENEIHTLSRSIVQAWNQI